MSASPNAPSGPAKAPVLILAIGNPSRGDDAFGPVLAQQLQAWLATAGSPYRARIELITDMQLMVEHVLDLQGRDRILFIDAAAHGDIGTPCITAIKPSPAPTVQSHACTPASLLALHADLMPGLTPPAELLSLAGQGFELGAPLTPCMQAAMPKAWRSLQAWIEQAAAHAA